jgi:AcrR family transcriptional regulator
VEKTSLAEISAKAKISKGTLYYHFSTKNDLVFAVTEMHMESLTENLLRLLSTVVILPRKLLENFLIRFQVRKQEAGCIFILYVKQLLKTGNFLKNFMIFTASGRRC